MAISRWKSRGKKNRVSMNVFKKIIWVYIIDMNGINDDICYKIWLYYQYIKFFTIN